MADVKKIGIKDGVAIGRRAQWDVVMRKNRIFAAGLNFRE